MVNTFYKKKSNRYIAAIHILYINKGTGDVEQRVVHERIYQPQKYSKRTINYSNFLRSHSALSRRNKKTKSIDLYVHSETTDQMAKLLILNHFNLNIAPYL